MPVNDPNFWQELGKWVGGIITTALAFFGMVNKWHGDRFKQVNARVDEVEQKSAKQDVEIATLRAESVNAHEDRVEIKQKLDKVVDLLMQKSG